MSGSRYNAVSLSKSLLSMKNLICMHKGRYGHNCVRLKLRTYARVAHARPVPVEAHCVSGCTFLVRQQELRYMACGSKRCGSFAPQTGASQRPHHAQTARGTARHARAP